MIVTFSFVHHASEAETSTVKAINFNKSSITFSSYTLVDDRTRVCANLEVKEVSKHERYLGMLIFVGENKNEIFDFLIDRVG